MTDTDTITTSTIIEVPVVPVRIRNHWQLVYLSPCPYDGKRHRHGGGTDPASPDGLGEIWSSHCGVAHPAQGQWCEREHRAGRWLCYRHHGHQVRLRLATPLEVELAEGIRTNRGVPTDSEPTR